jgi:hypothetical protein
MKEFHLGDKPITMYKILILGIIISVVGIVGILYLYENYDMTEKKHFLKLPDTECNYTDENNINGTLYNCRWVK